MPKNGTVRKLLPAKSGSNMQHLEEGLLTNKRRNVSLACTECQRKRRKVRNILPYLKKVLTYICNIVLWNDSMRQMRGRSMPVQI